jgi:hypothetical protein
MEEVNDQQQVPKGANGPDAGFELNYNIILALGILSIVGCWLYGVPGLIAGLVSLKYSNKVLDRVKREDKLQSVSGINKVKSARIFALTGVVLSGLYLLGLIITLIFYRSV